DPAGSVAHNDLLAFDIEGDVDVDLLRRCLRALAERHESLRISFASDGERQRIHRTSDVDLGVIDLSARDDAEEAWDGWIARETGHVFDLTRPALLRAHVFRLADQRHRLVIAANQVVLDGWSIGVLLREWAVLYNDARATGIVNTAVLPPVPSYAEYVRRQLAYRESSEAEAVRAFWADRL